MTTLLTLALLLAQAPLAAPDSSWDARRAEHLLNRAGFGASPEDVARAVERGLEESVAELFAPRASYVEPFYTRIRRRGALQDMTGGDGEASREERDRIKRRIRNEEASQLRDFLAWWIERMLSGEDPLRERMTLFLSGHFTSSMEDVKNSHEMIEQNRLLRAHALGSLRELVHAIARDPAMLEYLDNDVNRRGHPNENFARELMELFTLGEGNYTEDDVKEAARAFTGWTDDEGEFRFQRGRHDRGEKTVLGRTGKLGGDDVIDVLLDDPACPRLFARKLLVYFEGVEPGEERLERYADVIRAEDLELEPVLRTLFLDEDFYREEAIGARISSPIDFLVGSARRLGVEPPAHLVLLGANLLGERLFYPPNVKGWEGGPAWMTTQSLMQRGNLAGVMLGQVTFEDFLDYDPEAELDPAGTEDEMRMDAGMESMEREPMSERALGDLRRLKELRRSWRPRVNLIGMLEREGARSDREIVESLVGRLLAVPVSEETLAELEDHFRLLRDEADLAQMELFERPWETEPMLRTFAHLVLSLPEAQVH